MTIPTTTEIDVLHSKKTKSLLYPGLQFVQPFGRFLIELFSASQICQVKRANL